jgi:hypothetical protein
MQGCKVQKSNATVEWLRGVWRGLSVELGFTRGEYDVNVTRDSLTIRTRTGVYLSGKVQTVTLPGEQLSEQWWVTASTGSVVSAGTVVKFLVAYGAADPGFNLIAFAFDKKNPGKVPASFDDAMKTTGTTQVFHFSRCESENCTYDHIWGSAPRPLDAAAAPLSTGPIEDFCNQFSLCKSDDPKQNCIGEHTDPSGTPWHCVWCTAEFSYKDGKATIPTPYKCGGLVNGTGYKGLQCLGGKEIQSPQQCNFFCCDTGADQCIPCDSTDPRATTLDECKTTCKPGPPSWTDCPLTGDRRGYQFEKSYPLGEVDGKFTPSTLVLSEAKPDETKGYITHYTIECQVKDAKHGMVRLNVTQSADPALKAGDVLYGAYDVTKGTTGASEINTLAFAIAPKGATTSLPVEAAGHFANYTTILFLACVPNKGTGELCDFSTAMPSVEEAVYV